MEDRFKELSNHIEGEMRVCKDCIINGAFNEFDEYRFLVSMHTCYKSILELINSGKFSYFDMPTELTKRLHADEDCLTIGGAKSLEDYKIMSGSMRALNEVINHMKNVLKDL